MQLSSETPDMREHDQFIFLCKKKTSWQNAQAYDEGQSVCSFASGGDEIAVSGN